MQPRLQRRLLHLDRLLILFLIGGVIYCLIELAWRGKTHPSMLIVGGLCFVLIGLINEIFPWDMIIYKQMIISSVLVTVVEFIAGLIVNIWLGLNVWDYSNLPLNILGQVCVPFMFLWFLLSLPAIILDDYLRYKLFNEEKPHYKWR